jgi:hypothetical protein
MCDVESFSLPLKSSLLFRKRAIKKDPDRHPDLFKTPIGERSIFHDLSSRAVINSAGGISEKDEFILFEFGEVVEIQRCGMTIGENHIGRVAMTHIEYRAFVGERVGVPAFFEGNAPCFSEECRGIGFGEQIGIHDCG